MRLNLKKAVAVVTAALTICAMSVTAFAQGSVKSTGVVSPQGAKDANGNSVTVSTASIPAEYAEAVNTVKTTDGLKAVLGDAYVEGMEVVDAMDVSVPEGTTILEAARASITIKKSGFVFSITPSIISL